MATYNRQIIAGSNEIGSVYFPTQIDKMTISNQGDDTAYIDIGTALASTGHFPLYAGDVLNVAVKDCSGLSATTTGSAYLYIMGATFY